jgi:membrane protein
VPHDSTGIENALRWKTPGMPDPLPPAASTRPREDVPAPERHEPELRDPGLTDFTLRDWRAILVRTGKGALADGVTDVAASLAYYAFLAVPAALLVTLGLFTVTAGPDTVDSLMDRLDGVVPPEAITLLEESLNRALENQGGGVVMVVIGTLLALWTSTGAMSGLIRGLNRVYGTKEERGFPKQRLTALFMLACVLFAFALVVVLLVLGPVVSGWLGGVLDLEDVFGWIWWTVQWPVLLLGLLLAISAILYLGPNVEQPRFRLVTPGSILSVLIWLAASGLFALYVGLFGSYNKTWGSLAAVIIMLTWLWLSALAILLGAELNAEVKRSWRHRQGEPARDG